MRNATCKKQIGRVKIRPASQDRLAWWREARFGMFIHWGLYAIPAGIWKGKEYPSIGEWIMRLANIPAKEYEQLANKFNPIKFDADAWVRIAKNAGMKYLVITAKHHDGFALFRSSAAPYNIVDATPYGRDPMKELAKACQKAGIRLCFYYSHDQDWHDPNASGNTWDYPDEEKKDFRKYLTDKVKPQLHELLTQYGPIGLIWFDTPYTINKAQSIELKQHVHSLQPKCIVNGRVGNGVGEYACMGDNQFPDTKVAGEWETPATLNDTWGFKKNDHNWKSVKTILYLLTDAVGKGGNYLLNVGPRADGIIPRASIIRLEKVGQWLKANGEAIYGAEGGPYARRFPWGCITQKRNRLYLILSDWPSNGQFTLSGLHNKVKAAYLLANRKCRLSFRQIYDRSQTCSDLELTLPRKRPDKYFSVVVLEIHGKAKATDFNLMELKGATLLEPGVPRQGELIIRNPRLSALTGNLSISLPKSLRYDGQKKVRLNIPAKESLSVPFTVTAHNVPEGIYTAKCILRQGTLPLGILEEQYLVKTIGLLPRAQHKIQLRGNKADWQGIRPMTADTKEHLIIGRPDGDDEERWKGPEDLSFTAYAAWNNDGLYVRVDVTDESLLLAPEKVIQKKDNFHLYDCVEIFLVAAGEKIEKALQSAVHLLIVPHLGDMFAKCVLQSANIGAGMKINAEFVGCRTKKGYVVEGRVTPQGNSTLKLKHGQIIGFDVAVDDAGSIAGKRKSQMVLHAKTSNFYGDPASWAWFRM